MSVNNLLRELSKRFPQDLWIRVIDNDGEFLLIEAGAIVPPELDGPELGSNKVSAPYRISCLTFADITAGLD